MHWLVYGAGAVGGVLGARMHHAGLDVTLVARGDHLAAIRSRGLTLGADAYLRKPIRREELVDALQQVGAL